MKKLKILVVCRGSQGDIYPHFALSKKLMERGRDVVLNITHQFEDVARASGVPYVINTDKGFDDMIGESGVTLTRALKWLGEVIDRQFEYFTPMVKDFDLVIAGNAEFALPHIAEYSGKPVVRTSFAPVLPTDKFMPPLTPVTKPSPFLSIPMMWRLTNWGIGLPTLKPINANRKKLGLAPIKNQGEYAPAHAFNLLMYSPLIGDVDPQWNYRWDISGYCFYEDLPRDQAMYQRFLDFVKRGDKKILFFTVGSINVARQREISQWLLGICKKHNYKLVIGESWRKTGAELPPDDDLFILDGIFPHRLVLPYCEAAIHHGGCGTIHSLARECKPQMICSAFVDQPYWAARLKRLGLGSGAINTKKITFAALEDKIVDLMENPGYKQNARRLAEELNRENGLEKAAGIVERLVSADAGAA